MFQCVKALVGSGYLLVRFQQLRTLAVATLTGSALQVQEHRLRDAVSPES